MKYYLSLVATLLFFTLQAQTIDTLKHIVHFGIDQDDLTAQEISKLNTFILENKEIAKSFQLIGHTDNTGSETYNLDLSKRRVTTVHDHIRALINAEDKQDVLIYSTYRGEKEPILPNATAPQKAKNRRVEVYLLYQNNIVVPRNLSEEEFIRSNPRRNPELIVNEVGVNQNEKTAPLTIQGVQFFCGGDEEVPTGVGGELEVILTGEQAYQAGLRTYTNEGVPLISEGMIRVLPCKAGGSTDLPEPVTVRIPISDKSTEIPNLYDIDVQGNWVLREGEGFEVVEENGQRFYTTTVSKCGWINADIPKNSGQIEIKPVGKLIVRKIHLVENYPNYNYDLFYNLHSREATVIPEAIRVDSRAYVYCTIRDKTEIKTYKLPLTHLNGTRKIRTYPTINKKRVSWWTGLFRKTEPVEYTCYKLHARDLKEFKPIKVSSKANG